MKGGYRWLLVALLWVILLLNYLDRQVIFSVFPLLRKELNLTAVQLGLISTVFLWVYAAASPLAGYLADRFGGTPIIVTSLLVWSGVTWATGHVRSFPELLVARGLMGLSEACYLPAGLALIAAWHDEGTRAKATGLHYSGLYVGMVLGGALGGWMGATYGWRWAFTILGIVGVAYALVAVLLLKDKERARQGQGISFGSAARQVFGLPGYGGLFTTFAFVSMANWVVYTWLPLYLYERFHMDLAQAGFAATFYLQAGSLLGVALGGWLGDRGDRPRAWTQAMGLLAAAPFLLLAGFTSSTALLLGGMVVFGVGRGVYDANAMPALCQIAPASLRATGFGLFNLIGPLAGGIVAAAAGALKATVGIGGTLQVVAGVLALGALLLWRAQPAAVYSPNSSR